MVAVAVRAHHERLVLELLNDRQQLIVQRAVVLVPEGGGGLHQDLDGPCAVLVQCHVDHVGQDRKDQTLELVLAADLNDALTQVVSELVAGGLVENGKHLVEQRRRELAFARLQLFKFLLDHPAAHLVEAKCAQFFQNFLILFG